MCFVSLDAAFVLVRLLFIAGTAKKQRESQATFEKRIMVSKIYRSMNVMILRWKMTYKHQKILQLHLMNLLWLAMMRQSDKKISKKIATALVG